MVRQALAVGLLLAQVAQRPVKEIWEWTDGIGRAPGKTIEDLARDEFVDAIVVAQFTGRTRLLEDEYVYPSPFARYADLPVPVAGLRVAEQRIVISEHRVHLSAARTSEVPSGATAGIHDHISGWR